MKIIKSKKFSNPQDLKRFYDNHGWVSIKKQLDNKDLRLIQESLDVFFHKYTKFNFNKSVIYLNRKNKKKLYDLHMIANKCLSLNIFSKIFEKTSKILNGSRSPVLQVQTGFMLGLPKDKRLTYDFHQESNYSRNYNDLITVHFPLFYKVNIKNGTMSALNKSHKLGLLNFDIIRSSSRSYTTLLPKNIEKISNKFEEIFFELELGDVLYFHQNLIHKSNFNASNKCRAVGVIRLTQNFNQGKFTKLKPSEL